MSAPASRPPAPKPEHALRRRYGGELALGLALLALASAALYLGRGSRREPPPHESPGAAPRASAARAEPGEPSPRSLEARREALTPGAPPPESGGVPGTFAVEVVDETGRALAGVSVLLVTSDRTGRRDLSRPRFDAECPSGPGGRAFFSLTLVESLRSLAASHGAEAGFQLTTNPDSPDAPRLALPARIAEGSVFRLALPAAVAAAFGTLRVRVIDASGAPVAGAPVRWLAWPAEHADPPSFPAIGDEARTDVEGRVQLSLVSYRRLRERELVDGARHRYRVQLVVPPESPHVDLGTAFPPPDEIALRLPSVGSLSVRVLSAAGEPVHARASVRLWGYGERVAPDDELAREQPLVDGTALFTQVGLGLGLRVDAALQDDSVAPGTLELAGPRRAGERVEAVVRLGRELPALRLRLVDESGAPFARTSVRANLVSEGAGVGWWPQSERETDAEGRLFLRLVVGSGPAPRALTLEVPATRGERPRPAVRAEIDISRLDPRGVHDLGQVTLSSKR